MSRAFVKGQLEKAELAVPRTRPARIQVYRGRDHRRVPHDEARRCLWQAVTGITSGCALDRERVCIRARRGDDATRGPGWNRDGVVAGSQIDIGDNRRGKGAGDRDWTN